MKCPFCAYTESKVVDSRPTEEGEKIRRRRECLSCGRRFTTYEVIENLPLIVIKKDKSRELFDRDKLLGGLIRACEKRPIPLSRLEELAAEIESSFLNSLVGEVTTTAIGEKVMAELKQIDEVAYVRFASVYREFKDINSFMEELKQLLQKDGR